ncbi:Delta(24)-sterol reductase [Oopsacas minuta]|uniref:Delta(24)-sterol reductase n=1 Tax=Oopsacas minuta TaxID=111878 RepID=A0AAV7KM38_9METZ|nr:Delta(24)-sterol reductase [Oopsacas minuta]
MKEWLVCLTPVFIAIFLFLYFKFEYVLTHHRGLFVCIFLLPISFIYELYFCLRNRVVIYLHSAPENHLKRVQQVQDSVKKWAVEGRGRRMCTARPSFLTVSMKYSAYKDTHWKVPINLHDILDIDIQHKKCKVEPLVTMGQISASLNPLGWTLPVLPELDDLTVGGLIMGVGIETSSHIYGLFQHTCISYDVILSDGSLMHCNADSNKNMFYAIPWSYGTLGFLVAVEIMIVPAKPFVEITYFPYNEVSKLVEKFKLESNKNESDFVEGVILTKSAGVVMTGKLCDTPKSENLINRIGRFWKPWFFTHVNTFLTKGIATEYIPLRDYYHRHTRSLFWEMQDIIPFGNNPVFRYTCGWMVPPKISLLKLTQTNTTKRLYDEKHVTQDILLPIETLSETLTVFNEEFNVYPLWLCPFKLPNNPGLVHPKEPETVMYVDVGAYGVPKIQNFNAKNALRSVEAFTRRVNGFQMMYADTRMTREEFRKMFDHELYDRMRKELKCENAFPEIYDKVGKHAWK